MKESKHYISLKLKGGNAFHANGQRLKLTEHIVNIGETPDCDVRYESKELEPIYYAAIIHNEDDHSWRIVKRSQHIDINIVGQGNIGYAHALRDGDLIQFGEQPITLCFHQHYDNRYDDPDGKDVIWRWAMAGAIVLLAIIAAVLSLGQKDEGITVLDTEPLEESIFLTKVDSVCRVLVSDGEEHMLPPMKILKGEAPTGTAFLTTEGRMVTARHCVEYWIGTNLDLTTQVAALDSNDIVRWAIETETFNQTHEDESMQLRVYFSLYDFIGTQRYAFTSMDQRVHINTDKDGIFLLADFSNEYYWRTVRPYFTDRQMELGDIMWIDSIPEKGKVKVASTSDMEQVKNGTKLVICGYPMTGIGDKQMTSTEGSIRRQAQASSENLFFESNINHGFSGGPVLMKHEDEVLAIGVVSRVDSVSSGLYKWAVPITEINQEEP